MACPPIKWRNIYKVSYASVVHMLSCFSILIRCIPLPSERCSISLCDKLHSRQALTVLEYLLKNGSELCVRLTRAEIVHKLEDLETFEYVSVEGRDQGINVRLRCLQIRALACVEARVFALVA